MGILLHKLATLCYMSIASCACKHASQNRHFLDEADALADRVAILREGRLAASGPALALKARYCDGMTLTVTTALEGAATDVPALERLLGRHVAGARRLRWSGAELVRSLCSSCAGLECISYSDGHAFKLWKAYALLAWYGRSVFKSFTMQ